MIADVRDSARPPRRPWSAPALERQPSLTDLTQSAMLFMFVSQQCFDMNGNPVPCHP